MDLGASAKDTSNSIQYMVVNRVMKMNDAKADRDSQRYYTYFKFSLQLIMPHIKIQTRERLQQDLNKMKEIEEEINSDNQMSKSSKDDQLMKLRWVFADNREFHILDALPRIGLGKDLEEGSINFDKTDINTLSKAIRDVGTGLLPASEGVKAPTVPKEEQTPKTPYMKDGSK